MLALRRGRPAIVLATVALVLAIAPSAPSAAASAALRDVLIVGNAGGGTVTFIDGRSFAVIGSFNAIPDLQQRLAAMNPIERAGYEIVRAELGDKFVDDAFLSADGTVLFVSRANLADVVAFDLTTGAQRWRFKVEGFHADHMALSPDGSRLIVSATTAQKAQVVNAATGALVTTFATGAYPHANDYSPDGTLLYNSSIGVTSIPKLLEFLKGPRQLTVVDPVTFRVRRTYQFAHGIRPAVFTADNTIMYAQLSYLNGFVEYDLRAGRITRTITLPYAAGGATLRPDDYPGNSAHHGMAMSGDGARLCVAGTIDDYAAIIARPSLATERITPVGHIPYWTLTSVDGNHCFVSLSGDDAVVVLSYQTGQVLARVGVGDFPQRERLGQLSSAAVAVA